MNENLTHIKTKLTTQESSSLNKPIKENEIKQAIKELMDEKSPGDDGLPKEFYAKFQEIIIPELSEIYNNILLSGRQPLSPKKCHNKTYLQKR